MIFGMKKLEMLGGIGSLCTSLLCIGIGTMDYQTGQSWKIWAIMAVVLVINGIAMLVKASTRPDVHPSTHPVDAIAKARI